MTQEQETHLKEILLVAATLIDSKYRKGAAEHGDTFRNMPPTQVIEEMLGEVTDLLVFTIDLSRKLLAFKEKHDLHGPRDTVDGAVAGGVPQTPVRSVRDLPSNENLY